jgi:Lactoylglutathione lyase and related lyases
MRPHLSLNVRDVQKSVAFYNKVFGVAPQKQVEGYAKFDLKEPHLNFSLLEVNEKRLPSRVNHLGIEVMSEKEVEL